MRQTRRKLPLSARHYCSAAIPNLQRRRSTETLPGPMWYICQINLLIMLLARSCVLQVSYRRTEHHQWSSAESVHCVRADNAAQHDALCRLQLVHILGDWQMAFCPITYSLGRCCECSGFHSWKMKVGFVYGRCVVCDYIDAGHLPRSAPSLMHED